MKDFKTAAAGNAPDGPSPRESTSAYPPAHPAAAGIALSDRDAERLRAAYIALTALCDELGLGTTTFTLHGLSEHSAFEVFPDGTMHDSLPLTWDLMRGCHHAHLFLPRRDTSSRYVPPTLSADEGTNA